MGETTMLPVDYLGEVQELKRRATGKGQLLPIQFLELFKEDLYYELARHANAMAMKISDALRNIGFTFLT